MRILVVEDEDGIVSFLKQGLEEESFTVDTASQGKLGLEMALSKQYDIVLLDWMLPGISGLEICKAFRKENSTTPILFLTAKDTLDDTLEGLKAGANDYLKKPFHFEELLERIKVQLRTNSKQPSSFHLGPITLNTNTHQVFQSNDEVHLTQKEFELLEYLMKNKGRVCERKEIIEKVWNIHFEYNTGVIDVHMNSLRKKLMFSKDDTYIQTIRGVGYIAKE